MKWSNSSLATLQQCGEKFRRKYLERQWSPSSPAALRGTVVHKVARTALLRKMRERALPTVEEAKDLAATEFDLSWKAGVQLSKEEAAEGAAKIEAHSKDFAVDLAGFHVARVAPAIEPVGVERKIIVRPKDSDLEINGVIDLIDRRPEGEVIRDLKTSQKSPSKDAADKSQQLSIYAMIRMAEVGQLPHHLTLDTLVRTPARADKSHVSLDTTRDSEDVNALVNRINTAVEAVKRGVFVPASPTEWYCSAKYCEFFASCVYTRRTERPTS